MGKPPSIEEVVGAVAAGVIGESVFMRIGAMSLIVGLHMLIAIPNGALLVMMLILFQRGGDF